MGLVQWNNTNSFLTSLPLILSSSFSAHFHTYALLLYSLKTVLQWLNREICGRRGKGDGKVVVEKIGREKVVQNTLNTGCSLLYSLRHARNESKRVEFLSFWASVCRQRGGWRGGTSCTFFVSLWNFSLFTSSSRSPKPPHTNLFWVCFLRLWSNGNHWWWVQIAEKTFAPPLLPAGPRMHKCQGALAYRYTHNIVRERAIHRVDHQQITKLRRGHETANAKRGLH